MDKKTMTVKSNPSFYSAFAKTFFNDKYKKTCAFCTKTFVSERVTAQYCSKECRLQHSYALHRAPVSERICPRCLIHFMQKRRNQKYCSKNCGLSYRYKQHASNKKHEKKVINDRPCIFCKKVYTPHNGKQKYCSALCQGRHRRQRDTYNSFDRYFTRELTKLKYEVHNYV